MAVKNPTTWAEYLAAISGNATGRDIARVTQNSESTVSRWLGGTAQPTARQAAVVARAYGENPLHALMLTGYLTEEETGIAQQPPRALNLREYSDLELATEMLRRVAAGKATDVVTEPTTEEMLEDVRPPGTL